MLHRRFDRIARLLGENAIHKLQASHVAIIGLGGIGSWASESLIRSGVGKITLVDFDDICVTNTNRQIHSQQNQIGQKKVYAMASRLRQINPQSSVFEIPFFCNHETIDSIIDPSLDYIIDAIDNVTAKCFLLNYCRVKNIPIITSGGSSGRKDPFSITLSDLAKTHTDPFAQQVRKILRQKYDFPRKGPFNIPCVFSTEEAHDPIPLSYDKNDEYKCVCPQGQNQLHSCEDRNVIYGSAGYVTGTFGFMMASKVINDLIHKTSEAT